MSVELEKKKKRKLGGVVFLIIFEEDEDEKVVEIVKLVVVVGGVRKRLFVFRMNKGLVGKVIGIGGLGKVFLLLKRDKRGVGVSFLV